MRWLYPEISRSGSQFQSGMIPNPRARLRVSMSMLVVSSLMDAQSLKAGLRWRFSGWARSVVRTAYRSDLLDQACESTVRAACAVFVRKAAGE